MNKAVNQSHYSSKEQKPFGLQSLFSILGVLGSLLIFIFIIIIAYLPNRSESVDSERIKERELNLKQNKAAQQSQANSYGWIDKTAGVIRIPIDEAVELAVEKLAQKQHQDIQKEDSSSTSKIPLSGE